ncbi:MAG: hypothetical protein FWG10_06330 [Eubacteriaceae bacterium]|nr:hypothetical protein [Eubacteriaceae bacterium]
MKKKKGLVIITILVVCLLCSCGQPASKSGGISQITPVIHNNGGLYVKYGHDIYYREYLAGSLEKTSLGVSFPAVAGAQSNIMRLNPDGSKDLLFLDYGNGPIYMMAGDTGDGPIFILNRLHGINDGYYDWEIYGSKLDGEDCGFNMSGEIFAFDEDSSRIIFTRTGNGIYAANLDSVQEEQIAPNGYYPVYYDKASQLLFCVQSSYDDDYITIAAIDSGTSAIEVLFSKSKEEIHQATTGDEFYGQFFEVKNPIFDGGQFFVDIAEYGGTGYFFFSYGRVKIDIGTKEFEYIQKPAAIEWFGVDKPFSYRSDGPFYKEVEGFWMFDNLGGAEPMQVLTKSDMADAGLPEGEYLGEDDFVVLRDIEHVDGSVFFTTYSGVRNEEEDIGWRYGYDLVESRTYKKDLGSGEIDLICQYFQDGINPLAGAIRFGFADGSGCRLISGGELDGEQFPDKYSSAIGPYGVQIDVEYEGWQEENPANSFRDTASNFDNLPGYIYTNSGGKLQADTTHALMSTDMLGSLVEMHKPDDYNTPLAPSVVKQIETAKSRKIVSSEELATTEDGVVIGLALFERVGDGMLFSIVLVDGESMLFWDNPAEYNEYSTWRVDMGDEPGRFIPMFALRLDGNLATAFAWGAPEGEGVVVLNESGGVLKELGDYWYSRYWVPF